MSTLVKYEGDGEWSALYVDGKLDKVGDHYLISERIEELAEVEVIRSNDFLRGGDQRANVAASLESIQNYTRSREAREDAAKQLREQAADLLARAEDLEGRK